LLRILEGQEVDRPHVSAGGSAIRPWSSAFVVPSSPQSV
jgi:hypothetical protein